MPRADEPKRSVRLAPEDLAMLEAASQRCNVAVGALIRECVRRSASAVAADASAGRVTLRRRSAAAPVPSPAAPSSGVPKPELPRVEGVVTGRDLLMRERQRKLNERRP